MNLPGNLPSCLIGKNVKVGERAATNRAYAFALYAHKMLEFCSQCIQLVPDGPGYSCSRCKLTKYCSKDCQKKDWGLHKADCQVIQRTGEAPWHLFRLYHRIFQKEKKTIKEEKGDLRWRTLNDLMTHEEEFRQDHERWAFLEGEMAACQSFYWDQPASKEDISRLQRIIMKIRINSWNVSAPGRPQVGEEDGEIEDVGVGVFLSFSILDHSCDPMAAVQSDGRNSYLQIIREPKSPDELVTISYGNVGLQDRTERQAPLKKEFYFTCTCHWCTDDSRERLIHSFKCSGTDCKEVLTLNDGPVCPRGHSLTAVYIDQVKVEMYRCHEFANLLQKDNPSPLWLSAAVSIFRDTILHVCNIDRVLLGKAIVDCKEARPMGLNNAQVLADVGVQTVEGMRQVIPKGLVFVSFMVSVADLLHDALQYIEKKKYLSEAKEIMNQRESGLYP